MDKKLLIACMLIANMPLSAGLFKKKPPRGTKVKNIINQSDRAVYISAPDNSIKYKIKAGETATLNDTNIIPPKGSQSFLLKTNIREKPNGEYSFAAKYKFYDKNWVVYLAWTDKPFFKKKKSGKKSYCVNIIVKKDYRAKIENTPCE